MVAALNCQSPTAILRAFLTILPTKCQLLSKIYPYPGAEEVKPKVGREGAGSKSSSVCE